MALAAATQAQPNSVRDRVPGSPRHYLHLAPEATEID